ncbi:S41 family peptidase [Ferruginibacter sp.]|nr:PD40 domain-containing protein [Ferruginibacter sp.]
MKKILLQFFILTAVTAVAQQPLLLRQPAVNNDGSLVAFSFQGDIWTVPVAGGKAARLTIHEAYESSPVFSPDGKQIAFSGARFGNNDIFIMPSEGGFPKRLTYHSAGDNIASWTQTDQIIFSTSREFRQIERPSEVYSVSPKGGTEKRIMDVLGYDPVISPNGNFIAFVHGDINPVARQDYRGSSNRDIWMYDTKNKTYTKLPGFSTNDILPQWSGNNSLYFLSSDEGAYNLYKLKIDAGGKASGTPEKLTDFKNESIRSYNLSADGSTIVFEKEMDLFLMKTAGGAAKKINVVINADERFDATEQKTIGTGAESFSISPNGKLMAYTTRGEVFIKEADKEKSRSINVSDHSFRDVEPVWLNDSALLFCSDRANGNFDMYLFRSSDTTERNVFKSMKHDLLKITNTDKDETAPVISPDGKKIAYIRGRGVFVVSDIAADGKLSNEKILNSSWASPNGITWSPDSKWLAFSLADLDFNGEIFIQAADNSGKAVNVSMHPRSDNQPFWSADGSKLGFISERSSSRSDDVYFVWLKKEDWEKENADWQDKEPAAADKPSGDKKTAKPVKIDFDKIHERIVQVTNFPGDENELNISKDGETFFYTTASSTAKGRDLYSIKWDGKELKELTKGGSGPNNITMDKEGKYLYYSRTGAMARLDIKTGMTDPLPFVAKMKVDYVAERTQIFEEAWRTIRDGFYDPNFHGYNWSKLHDKYKERCVYASTNNDFRDMFNLMLGELNSSHMGLTAPDRAETQREFTGLLGAELMPAGNGMKVNHVIAETPADKTNSKLNEGDIITAVNGQTFTAEENFYSLLNGLATEKILLAVTNAAGKQREVIIRPTTSVVTNLYEEWVENRKKLVEKFSNGRLGYIHIRSMDFPSFEVVEREFTAAGFGKEGLLIDVRYNGGGSTTDYLMTILNYKQHAYTIPRGASDNLEKDKKQFRSHYPVGERLVYAAWTKPSITLCNEGSYSNAEIFSHAYKTLGIGKLVGVPTNGSVISTGGKGLLDGSFVRLPGRGWYTKATDKNQELGPAVPDIIVENKIDWISKGTDDQLKIAVEELLKEINNKK